MNEPAQKPAWTWSRIARRIRVPLGFAFAALYLWLAKPTWTSIAAGCLIAAPGVWLRAIAAGHVRKNAELTTTGPYAYTRNPLYLGSVIIALGFGVASRSLWVAVAIIVLFLAIYLPVIKSEEVFLRGAFGDFDEYARNVPRLFPRLRAASGSTATSFSRQLYLKHREYNAVVGSLLMMLALVLKLVWTSAKTRGTI
jgi:protein-S-isoprenylcysteine O-methyltransferase Ste14